MQVSLSDRLSIKPNVIFRTVGAEALVLDLDGALYFGLDEVGTRIWQLLGDADLAAVAAALESEYDVDRAQAVEDVLAFVADLAAKGLVQPAASANA